MFKISPPPLTRMALMLVGTLLLGSCERLDNLMGDDRIKCEIERPVRFFNLNWESGRFHTAVARFIIEHGYGCKTSSLPGEEESAQKKMETGEVDVTMEIWLENIKKEWQAAEKANRVTLLGVTFPDATQGWYVPRYVVEGDVSRNIEAVAPGLKKVTDLPKYKNLFSDPAQPSKGRFYNCLEGWSCEIINTKKLAAYNLNGDYTNFHPNIADDLSNAISTAYAQGKPILFYYWSPTWIVGKYDLYQLEENPYNATLWKRLQAAKFGSGIIGTAYPTLKVYIGSTPTFVAAAPNIATFLRKYHTSSAVVSKALSQLRASASSTPTDAAKRFLRSNEKIWTEWVPEDVKNRVKIALH